MIDSNSALQPFTNPIFGTIRTFDLDGKPWFVGKDVADALGYGNPRTALAAHVDDEDKNTVSIQDGIRGNPNMTIINESGLYSLIFASHLPAAKQFKRWVTSEVLPAIRRTGGYLPHADQLSDAEIFARALDIAHRTIEQNYATIAAQEQRISTLAVQNELLRPKSDYFDQLVERGTLTNFRETAKQLDVPPKKFVQFLLDHKYIYRDKRGKLLPYEEKNDGLFSVRETINTKTNWSGTQTLVTPKGRETFRLLCEGL